MATTDLLLGRWEDVTANYADGSFDGIFTDPPYAITDEDNDTSRRKLNGWSGGNMKPLGGNGGMEWDKGHGGAFDNAPWLKEAFRLIRPGGAIVSFCDGKRPGELWDQMEAAGFSCKNTLYWTKTNPPTNPRKNYQSGVETMVFARKPGKIRYWGGGGAQLNYWKGPIVHYKHRIHDTQKPVALCRWLLNDHMPTGPDAILLDPFAGSGAFLIAGLELAINSVGIDMDPRTRQESLDWIARTIKDLNHVPRLRKGKVAA